MELSRESTDANLIRAWEPGRVRIGENWLSGNLIVTAEHVVTDWSAEDPGALTVEQLAPAIDLKPEIILLGTGADMLMPDVALMASLAERGIGLETMNTASACRTFNVLVHEQRRVAAVLFN